jgi:hypothetical protein
VLAFVSAATHNVIVAQINSVPCEAVEIEPHVNALHAPIVLAVPHSKAMPLVRAIPCPDLRILANGGIAEQVENLRLATFHRLDLRVCQLAIVTGNFGVSYRNLAIGRKCCILKFENVSVHNLYWPTGGLLV